MNEASWWRVRDGRLAWAYAVFGALALGAAAWLGATREVAGSGWGLWAMGISGALALGRAWLARPPR